MKESGMRVNVILAGLPRHGALSVLERMEALMEELRESAEGHVLVNCLYIQQEREDGEGAGANCEDVNDEMVKAWAGHQQASAVWMVPKGGKPRTGRAPADDSGSISCGTSASNPNDLPGGTPVSPPGDISASPHGSASQDAFRAAAAFVMEHPAELHLFCGTAEGEEIGRHTAALLGMECHGKTEGFLREDGLRLRRKVYSTHGEGWYPLDKVDAASDAAGSDDIAAEECTGHDSAGHVVIGSLSGRRQAWGAAQQARSMAATESATAGTEVKVFCPQAETDTFIAEALGDGRLPAVVTLEEEPRQKQDDLASARLVFVGGKGLGTKENYLRLKALAGKLGAACGCSRPAALSGWESYDRVVGISGVTLQAELCVTFGVSGAGPLVSGLEGAAHIIAVNTDKNAPIFRYAREGIAEDCMKIIAALEELKARENQKV